MLSSPQEIACSPHRNGRAGSYSCSARRARAALAGSLILGTVIAALSRHSDRIPAECTRGRPGTCKVAELLNKYEHFVQSLSEHARGH